MSTPAFPPKIRRLFKDHDLPGLETELRRPADAENRAQAARAMGELHDMEATQCLVRACLEDPEPMVKSAARAALELLLGSTATSVIATYRDGPPEEDEWLQEPLEDDEEGDEDWGSFGQELTQTEIDGLIQIARHEGNSSLRLQAIQTLGTSADLRAINALVDVALWADHDHVRHAAYEALARRFGSAQAREMIAVQRNAAVKEATERGEELDLPGDEEDSEEFTDEFDQDSDLAKGKNGILAEDDSVDEDDLDDDDEDDAPYTGTTSSSPVTSEIQTPWQVFLAAAVITALGILLLLLVIK